MYSSKKKTIGYWTLLCDVASLNIAFEAAHVLRFHSFLSPFGDPVYRTLWVIANGLYLLIHLSALRQPSLGRRQLLDTGFRDARAILLVFLVLYFAVIVFIQGYVYSRTFHLEFIAVFALIFSAQRVILLPWIRDFVLRKGKKIRVVLVGADDAGRMYFDKLQEMSDYYELAAVLDDNFANRKYFNGQFKGSAQELDGILRRERVDEVVVSIAPEDTQTIRRIVATAERHYAMVKLIPRYGSGLSWRELQIEDFDGMWLFTMSRSRLMLLRYQLSKRAFDLLFSFLVLVSLFPLLTFVVAPAIKLGTKGSAFFKQMRTGYRGEEFECVKYRTMKKMDKDLEVVQANVYDKRKTTLGGFLRKSSLDELPQFWNVLKGEMSVVGPRPHMVEHDRMYNEIISNYHVRLFAKPGITGWAQINGYRGATPDPELMRKRVEHDIWYLENWSFWLDMKIIFLTVLRIFKGDPNAY